MLGLREKQKIRRTRGILEAASALFRANGYGAVRLEDIAEAAEVSVGTCYNYFATKGDLLLAIVSMEVEEVVEAGRQIVAAPPADIAEALDRLIGSYVGHSLHYLSKEMWRTAIALSIEMPETPFSRRYAELDGMLSAQVSDLLRELQKAGYARAGFAPELMGRVIFNNLNQMFIDYVKDEARALPALRADLSGQNAVISALISA